MSDGMNNRDPGSDYEDGWRSSLHAGGDYYQRKKDPAFVRGNRKRGRQNYRANKRLREAHPEEFKRYLADEKAGDEQSLIRRRNGT